MQRKHWRVSASILVIVYLAILLPAPASASVSGGACGVSVTWTLNRTTGVLLLSGTGEMDHYAPDMGRPAPWYGWRSDIVQVIVTDSVTAIGAGAFSGCTGLTAVTVESASVTIADFAFQGCTALSELVFWGDAPPQLAGGVFSDTPDTGTLRYPAGGVGYGPAAFPGLSGWTFAPVLLDAEAPSFTAQPADAAYMAGDAAAPLTVAAAVSDGGTLGLQWYRSDRKASYGGIPIDDATEWSYTPPVDTVGTGYYYAVVTNYQTAALRNEMAETASACAAVAVTAPVAAPPVIDRQPAGASYPAGGEAVPLTVSASLSGSGTLSYQWYRSDTADTAGGTPLPGAVESRYLPPTSSAGTTYYYVVVTNTRAGKAASAASSCAAVVVTATPEEPPAPEWINPFDDVTADKWFYGAVQYVCENGLMYGISKTAFAPEDPVTRGMMATLLHRMAGTPAPRGNNTFQDVPPNTWYTAAVTWANETGIAVGDGDGTFRPEDALTRQELAAMLYRYENTGILRPDAAASPLDIFLDSGDVAGWANTAMEWAVSRGIINGFTDRSLRPSATSTRAQSATLLMQYLRTA